MTKSVRDVLVVGGGILGSTLAAQLTRGHRVTLLDSDLDTSATYRSFGWINAAGRIPATYHHLRQVAHQRWLLEASRTGGTWYHASGVLDWSYGAPWTLGPGLVQDESAQDVADRLLRAAHDVSLLETWDDVSQIEPLLNETAVELPALYARDESWIDGPAYVDLQRDAVRAAGGKIIAGRVERLVKRSDRVVGVELESGEHIDAELTVVATGGNVTQTLATAGIHVPSASNAGVTIITEPVAQWPASIVRGRGIGVHRLADGRLNVHAGQLEDEYAAHGELSDELIADVLKRAGGLVTTGEPLRAQRVLAGLRPIPGDGMPVVGELDDPAGVAVIFTHSGLTLGLLLAELLAAEISDPGFKVPILADYRPERFTETPQA